MVKDAPRTSASPNEILSHVKEGMGKLQHVGPVCPYRRHIVQTVQTVQWGHTHGGTWLRKSPAVLP